ncbi:MAG: VOC family protein [Anaerolineae bacterium]|nr:VOC family protein [Anaerolineae bacterium]
MQKVILFLWFDHQAEEAMYFYFASESGQYINGKETS